jgi:glutathione S-transferase
VKLYYAPNTCSLATLLALEEAGADYTLARVDFASNAQRAPEYLAINPKGRVPALETERGILTETPAMLAFLARTFPAAKLAPLDDAFELAQVESFNAYLCSTVHVAHAHRMRGARWADDPDAIEAMKRKVPESVFGAYDVIERTLFVGPWVRGERYGIADAYLFTLAQWLEGDGVDPARLPKIAEHRERVRNRPAVQRALANERG